MICDPQGLMTRESRQIYEFGPYHVNADRRLLLRDGEVVPLTPKCFEILLAFVESSGEVVGKETLLERVWPDSFVEEGNLTYNISILRKALGERAGEHQYIATVPGRGYKFVETVSIVRPDSPESDVTPVSEKTFANIGRHKLPLIALVLIAAAALIIVWGYMPGSPNKQKKPISRVAVLPLINTSGDPEMDYLSDGISENILNSLSQLPGLKVIARSSSFSYKGKETDPQEVARALNVEGIVTGRLLQRGDQLQISIELMDARDQTQVWGNQYTPRISDLLPVKADICRQIANNLRHDLTRGEQEQFAERETANPQAYELLLRGSFQADKGGTENRLKGVELMKQAISVDPDYARAYAALSMAYGILGRKPEARAAAEKALELDENLTYAHVAIANLHRDAWDWAAAELQYRRAIQLNPNLSPSPRARVEYSDFLSYLGRFDEALVEITRARELDPLNLHINNSLAIILFLARRYDEALLQAKKTLELDDSFPYAHFSLAVIYTAKGMYREAVDAFLELERRSGIDPMTQIYLGAAYAGAGERGKARAILKSVEMSKQEVSPAELAVLYASLGEREKAFASLEKAYAAHDPQLQYLKVTPDFDPLRSDPRFQDLLRRVGLPQ